VANTDEHGWGKDFDANCTNSREGGRGWMGCLPYGHRAQLAGGPPALRSEMRSAKRPSAFAKRLRRDKMKTQKLNQIKPFLNHRWTRIGSEPSWCSALRRRGSGLIRPNPTRKFKKRNLTTDCEPQWQTQMNTDGGGAQAKDTKDARDTRDVKDVKDVNGWGWGSQMRMAGGGGGQG